VAQLAIEHIHTFLVHPGKGHEDAPSIGGTTVALNGKLFRLLENIYVNSDRECDIEISFNPAADGAQQNPCRDLIIEYLQGPTLARGRQIAERLQSVSDGRTGLGLLFLIAGREAHDHKLVVSRFPTDSAILAEEDQRNLTVEFLERVFMKSATAYKAAAYQDRSLNAGFWQGRAVDRQINSRTIQVSDYWIAEFLASGFRLTAAAGTRRLGVALRQAAKNATDTQVKSEIAAAVTLAGSLRNRQTSIADFEEQFGLSPEARTAIERELRNPALTQERFRFDPDEFKNQVGFRSVQLDNGALMTAESGEFDDVFEKEVVDERTQQVRYSTSGKVVNERLRKAQS
jgi:hypothetical protein